MQKNVDVRLTASGSARGRMYSRPFPFRIPLSPAGQIWKIMRLTSFLLLAACLHVAAKSNSQSVTFSGEKVPLKKVFSVVEKQTGFFVFYNREMLNGANSVTINAKEMVLSDFLTLLFKDQPLNFRIEGKTIVLSRKSLEKIAAVETIVKKTASIPVTGRVTDTSGAPLAGASVKVKGTSKGTNTNATGEFTIEAQPGDILVISFVGYQQQEVRVSGNNILAVLKAAVSALDEVVTIAYGTSTRRLSTGNISSITSKQIENKPIQNVLLALQGEVPGIVVNQSTGFANSGIQVQIQGLNSIGKSNDPLYVVDGVPYNAQMLPTINAVGGYSSPLPDGGGSGGAGTIGNPLSFISPQDIESVSILKDADATAIYGSRAANGAILITTKKPKAGVSKVSVNLQQGFGKYGKFLKMLNREQYLQMRRDAYYGTDGLTNTSPEFATQYDLNGTWDTTRYTDWQKELLGGTASYTNGQVSLTGGNNYNQYILSAGYHRETTVYPVDNLSDQKATFHVGFNHSGVNGRFKAQFTANYQRDNNRLPVIDLTTNAVTLSPIAPALYKADGTLNWAPDANGNSTWTNPITNLNSKAYSKTTNLVSNLLLSYHLFKGMELSSNFGFTNMVVNELRTNPIIRNAPEFRASRTGSSYFNNGKIDSWNIEPQLNYRNVISKGKLDILLGTTFQEKNLNQALVFASNYSNDLLLEDLNSAGNIVSSGTAISTYRYNALFTRIGYNWDGKYIINLSGRRDGSSRFGANNSYNNFWSISGGWIFSEENFLKGRTSWLSFGKLRSSYGTTGNDGIGDYAFLNSYRTLSNVSTSYQGITALTAGGIPNPNLQWEENRKLDVGIDLGLLHDRIVVKGDYYRNRSSNQLLNYSLPNITGASSYTMNLPATVQNEGWEFAINATISKSKYFLWKTNFNISSVNNKLISFPDLATSSYFTSLLIGKPIGGTHLFKYADVNTQTGLYEFYTADGHLTSSPDYSNDRTEYVTYLTRFSGGISNDLTYKNFNLSFLFQFAKKDAPIYNIILPGSFASSSGQGNQPEYILDYWQQAGQSATFQKVSSKYADANISNAYYNAMYNSTFGFQDASFIRLKNVSISYSFPSDWISKYGVRDGRLFVNAQNVFTLSHYKGVDPEASNPRALPPLRVITFGVLLGL